MTEGNKVKLSTSRADLARTIEEFNSTPKIFSDPTITSAITDITSALNSPTIEALTIQEKRLEELMSVSNAALNCPSELVKTSRIAEDAMARLSRMDHLTALSFPDVGMIAHEYSELFRTPMLDELDKITVAAQQAMMSNDRALSIYLNDTNEIRRIVESIHSPWINSQDTLASFQGLGSLSSIGKALHNAEHPFEETTTSFLRDQLGDWRHTIVDTEVIMNPLPRLELYTEQGFNSSLTGFPSATFDELLVTTNIQKAETKSILQSDQQHIERKLDDGETAHNIEAYETIMKFENIIREFIDRIMTQAHGDSWVKHKVPGDMKQSWAKKKEKAQDSGEQTYPLIYYADFNDYEVVITKNDNWSSVFKSIFIHKESVTESLRRLKPIRITTMHSRIIMPEDILYLRAETMRLLSAMKKRNKDRFLWPQN